MTNGTVQAVLEGLRSKLTLKVETVFFGPITIRLDGVSDGQRSGLLEFLKPKATLQLDGAPLFTAAPYGDPAPTRAAVLPLMSASAVLAVIGVVKTFRK